MEEFDGINLLVVVIDVNPFVWAMAAKDPQRPVHFGEVMEHLTIFINAHLALRFDNKLAIVVSTVKKSEIIYTTDDVEDASAPGGGLDKSKKPPNVYKQFRYADDALMQRLKGLTKEFEHGSRQDINRVKRKAEGTPLQGRILTISVSSDGSAQYIPMMNCIFAAQKFGIRIDICKVYGPPSVFLPQASAITLGVFYDVADAKNLITYLMHIFLPDPKSRTVLCLPAEDNVDFRSACFCHKKVIDIGYVCSACLSIFCKSHQECPMCSTKVSNGVAA